MSSQSSVYTSPSNLLSSFKYIKAESSDAALELADSFQVANTTELLIAQFKNQRLWGGYDAMRIIIEEYVNNKLICFSEKS